MNSALLRDTLKKAEDVRPKMYLDSKGIPTIGVGWNLRDCPMRMNEIDFRLTNDITEAWQAVTTTWPWVLDLSDVRQRVLTEMVFQMGVGGVGEFKHALSAMQAGDWQTAHDQMLDSKWAREDSPGRAHRLATMMLSDLDQTS